MLTYKRKQLYTQAAALTLAAVVFSVFAIIASVGLNFYIGGDWEIFRAAGIAVTRGLSPFTADQYYSPPWVALASVPLALLSFETGALVMFVVNLFGFMFAYQRLRIHVLATPVLLYLSLHSVIFGNIEGLVALGMSMPPMWGLFFVLAKPQIGIGMAVWWAVEQYRKGGGKLVIKTFAPVSIAFLLSFAVYGWWPAANPVSEAWNASIFPWGVPFGLGLLAYAIYKRKPGGAIASGVLCSPYVNTFMSWAFLWIGLAEIASTYIREKKSPLT